ncbi:MAG: caspase family protein, partial [Deltaproteobacteria bacterium]|nr:caspase family protein [Deltaproteobacteria bacterium]
MTVPRSIIFTISVFLALLWLNLANEGLFALSEKGTVDTGVNHALVIGISDYAQWEKLKSPSKDAAEIAKILTEKYDFKKKNVVLLNDASKDKPTTANILTYISKYVSELS